MKAQLTECNDVSCMPEFVPHLLFIHKYRYPFECLKRCGVNSPRPFGNGVLICLAKRVGLIKGGSK